MLPSTTESTRVSVKKKIMQRETFVYEIVAKMNITGERFND